MEDAPEFGLDVKVCSFNSLDYCKLIYKLGHKPQKISVFFILIFHPLNHHVFSS